MQLPPIPPILSPCKFYIIRLPLSVHTCQNFLIKNVVISINPNLIHLHRNYFQFFPFSPKFFFKIYFLNVLYSLFFIMAFQRTGFDCLVFGSGWGSNWSPPPAPWGSLSTSATPTIPQFLRNKMEQLPRILLSILRQTL